MSLVELDIHLFAAYAGEEEGLPPPSLRRVPSGPVRTPLEKIEEAIERAQCARRREWNRSRLDCDGRRLNVGDHVVSKPRTDARPAHHGTVLGRGGGGDRIAVLHGDCCEPGRKSDSAANMWKKGWA
jgi:hypothetical protein